MGFKINHFKVAAVEGRKKKKIIFYVFFYLTMMEPNPVFLKSLHCKSRILTIHAYIVWIRCMSCPVPVISVLILFVCMGAKGGIMPGRRGTRLLTYIVWAQCIAMNE